MVKVGMLLMGKGLGMGVESDWVKKEILCFVLL